MHPPADNPVDISLTERYFSKVTDAEKALKNLTNFTDFEVFHLFGQRIEKWDKDEIENWIKVTQNKTIQSFANKVKKSDEKITKVQNSISELQSAISKGRIRKDFKTIIESNKIPKEALFKCTGKKFEDFVVDVENVLVGVQFDTEHMNILELACVFGYHDIFMFLVKDMNLRNARDFLKRENSMIHDQQFVYIPILKKNALIVRELLQISSLWTMDDLVDMMVLCKQAKWAEGITIVLQSKAMHRNFLALTHVDQNLFLHDTVKLSYELLDSNDYELAQMDDENHIKAAPVLISQKIVVKNGGLKQPQEGEKASKHRFNHKPWDLTENEKYEMKV